MEIRLLVGCATQRRGGGGEGVCTDTQQGALEASGDALHLGLYITGLSTQVEV